MPVQEYLNMMVEAKKKIDTRLFDLTRAYLDAVGTTTDGDGLIDLESLVNQPTRDRFKRRVIESLHQSILKFYHIDQAANSDIFRINDLWRAYVGFTPDYLDNLVEDSKENMSQDSFFRSIGDKLKEPLKTIDLTKLGALKATDGPEVIAYLAKNPANAGIIPHINVNSLTSVTDMAALIEENLSPHGVVRPNFIKGKPYYIP